MSSPREPNSISTGDAMIPPQESPANSGILRPTPISTAMSYDPSDLPTTVARKVEFRSLNILQMFTFGSSYLLIAAHLIGNGIIMAAISANAASAASLITTIHSVVVGFCLGLLQYTGMALSKITSNRESDTEEASFKEIRTIMQLAWLFTLGLGAISVTLFFCLPELLPVKPEIALETRNYFHLYAIATTFDTLITTNVQIPLRLEKNNWYFAPMMTIAYRGLALIFAWYLGIEQKMGVSGIGLSTIIGAIPAAVLSQLWFNNPFYKKYKLLTFGNGRMIKNKLPDFLYKGIQFAAQRLTEWGNLFIISLIIGIWGQSESIALQPSLQAMFLLNLFSQGFAQALMMSIGDTKNMMKTKLEDFGKTGNLEYITDYKDIRSHAYKEIATRCALGFFVNVAVCFAYYGRDGLLNIFNIDPNSSPVAALADSLLLANLISLPFDALRIISSSGLRGWDDIMGPTLASFILMTLIGIPFGVGLVNGLEFDITSLFWARNVFIALSFVANMWLMKRNHDHSKQDIVNAVYYRNILTPKIIDLTDINVRSGTISPSHVQAEEKTTPPQSTPHSIYDELFISVDGDNAKRGYRKRVARNIRDNIDSYEILAGGTNEDLTKLIEQQDPELISIATSFAWDKSIIIVKPNSEPRFIRNKIATEVSVIFLDDRGHVIPAALRPMGYQDKYAAQTARLREEIKTKSYYKLPKKPYTNCCFRQYKSAHILPVTSASHQPEPLELT